MAFKLINIENWERREFYEHFISTHEKTRGCRKLDKIRLATVFYENERKKLRTNCEEVKKEHTKERVG